MGWTAAACLVSWALPLGSLLAVPLLDAGRTAAPSEQSAQDQLTSLLSHALANVDRSPTEALEAAEQAQAVAEKLKLKEKLAEATFLVADAARAKGDHRRALEEFLRAKVLFTELDNRFELARCLRRLGDLYYFVSDFGTSTEYYLAAHQLFSQLAREGGNPKAQLHLAHLHAALGNVFNAAHQTEEAKSSYQQALTAYRALNYPLGVAGTTYNLGLIAQKQNDPAGALNLYQQAETQARELKDEYLLSLALSSQGSVFLAQGKTQEARKAVAESMAMCRASNRVRGVLDNLLKQAEIELTDRNYPKALAALEEGLALARRLGDKALEADGLELLARLREQQGKPLEALQHVRQAAAIRENVRSAETAARMSRLRIGYEVADKEQRILLLEERQVLERRLRWALVAALFLAITLLLVMGGRYRLPLRMERVVLEKNAQLEAAYQQVALLSRTDELTGLPNRRACLDLLAQEESRAQRGSYSFSVILCDVDDFKKCNDEFGHECGDAVLKQLAVLFRRQLRASDTVCRWGGEEFLFVLPDTDLEGALNLAHKLRKAVNSETFFWEGQGLGLTATFGVGQCHKSSARDVVRQADMAMYRGKLQGKDAVLA